MAKSLYVVALVGLRNLPSCRTPLYLNLTSNRADSRITADWLKRRCATEMPRAVAQAAASVVSFMRPELNLSIEEAE